ncbi:kelch repeat protein [Sporormia fimetaria CBS 119925]|uniref:Kelch repeat protein n=1 Tax=Sporormia fimetaria CBS 119925 TaxID=1340428 RepID=A0A6A6VQK0_9PLEO|nr:kelch repeat protein [Sporormia fimetaria CBS 119925]
MNQNNLSASLFAGNSSSAQTALASAASARTSPNSSANNTFLMTASPVRPRKSSSDGYKPKIITTIGAKPACLVNASVTFVGKDQIYAFGGFDQYTDEVYNHVLRLNLVTRQWNLVDNYGDIPGVRMGHTANFWRGDKLLVFGGENEHRQHLNDVIIFDLKTAHWTQPELHGPAPRGRARHSAVIHDEKLYISGGQTGHDSVLDDICFLDLKTWTWSRTWKFVPRYDHSSWVWNGRVWIFGGINEEMERNNEIWWLDLRGSPGFENVMTYGTNDRQLVSSRYRTLGNSTTQQPATGSTGYSANSSAQSYPSALSARPAYPAPGSISSLKFHSSPNLPSQTLGAHFHVFTSGCMLDFVTPAELSCETSLSVLELDTLRWQRLAEGKDLFDPSFRWHYCTMNPEGTHAWLLGTVPESSVDGNEFLSDVLSIDLSKYGILGNELAVASDPNSKIPASDANIVSPLTGIGADLSTTFDQPPESGSGADLIITAIPDDLDLEGATANGSTSGSISSTSTPVSRPIHVHKFILLARWPHFRRLWSAQMAEYHTKKMHIPEPYSTVRAFLFYLYTDNIAANPQNGPTLNDVAGMLVMANIYDMPRLRLLCRNRLSRELDIEHAAVIWERAGTASEEWLRRRAANFCMQHWGRVSRTEGFRLLPHDSLIELCQEPDVDARVVAGDELEIMNMLGRPYGGGNGNRKRSLGSAGIATVDEEGEDDLAEDDGMDVN